MGLSTPERHPARASLPIMTGSVHLGSTAAREAAESSTGHRWRRLADRRPRLPQRTVVVQSAEMTGDLHGVGTYARQAGERWGRENRGTVASAGSGADGTGC